MDCCGMQKINMKAFMWYQCKYSHYLVRRHVIDVVLLEHCIKYVW